MADPQSNAALPAHPSPERQSPLAPPELPPDAPRAGVLHVRHRHTERYTVVGNHLAQHPRLSATAIGIGVHIQSLPDGASVTIKALTLRFPEGEVTIGRALRELEEAGYLVRRRVPLGGGRIATRTFFLDHPRAVVHASVAGGSLEAVTPGAAAGPEPEVPSVPGPVAVPVAAEVSVPVCARTRSAAPEPVTVPTGPAADLLARLRLVDTRLLLSERDVARLVPAVETWLGRAATPDQITRTLTEGLPPEADPIRHPASFVEYRLTTLFPPPLPTAPIRTATAATHPAQRAPLVTCDGCERAIRTHDPRALCRECRERHDRGKAGAVHSAA
ncbi:hypothetical protein [Streptomyces nigra]|uniref:hypothetical protein n=1 Tax=Streptomyces nigra TaxID=1827580 RepID=UPI0037F7E421